jgi:putative redox protein
MVTVELERVQMDFGFEVKNDAGKMVQIDTSPEGGGHDFGVRPMQMLLMAVAGCSGIDVISILKKQRQEITSYKMKVSGHREHGKEPSLWKDVHIEFHIHGKVEQDKAQRAADLSITKYCSVAETLRRAGAEITYEVFVTAE